MNYFLMTKKGKKTIFIAHFEILLVLQKGIYLNNELILSTIGRIFYTERSGFVHII